LLKDYLGLLKPERTLANVITAGAGYLVAVKHQFHALLFIETIIGTTLIIASACVLNNIIDYRLDQRMKRTKDRPLASGRIGLMSAKIYSACLGIVGFAILAYLVNLLVALLGIIAYLDYVIIYGYVKRRSTWSTAVGGISGSLSMVAGYCAVTDKINLGTVLLFLIMAFWQMPHFFSIAIFRLKDYRAANMPVLPAVKNIRQVKIRMIGYVVCFTIACLALSIFGYTGYTFFVCALLSGLYWLRKALSGIGREKVNDIVWARAMFKNSLSILTFLCVIMALNPLVP
jgi:protoheme IX farnesyltransferase